MSWLTQDKVLWFEKFEDLKKEIFKLYNLWYNSIWYLWWEPTIHPNFLELINYAKDLGFENIETISNWSKFDNKEFLFNSIKNWLTRISISFHSIIESEESILVWWINWIVKQKLNAIENLINIYKKWFLKNEISINIVISNINYKSILKTILFLYKKWIKSFRLNFIQLEWSSTKNYEKLALKYEDFKPYLKKVINLYKIYIDIKINFEAIPWCSSWLNYYDYINYSEQEIDKQKDKISRDDINLISRDIKNQLKWRKELKSFLKKCENCFLKSNCEWIWNRYINYFNMK